MKVKPERILLIGGGVCICVCAAFLVWLKLPGRGSDTDREMPVSPTEQARTRAFGVIRRREQWPDSPEAVSKAFWNARANKDYEEMEVLWPGTTSAMWAKTCANEPNVTYVFGQASSDGTRVPYATEAYFEENGTYNLTMHLSALDTDRGRRFYITSGN